MIIQERLETPVRYDCDVLVAGGGVAGISAALSAARAGADVLLLEQEYLLGGLATAGLVNIYLPLDDGAGHLVSRGLAEELLRLALPDGAEPEEAENLRLWLTPHAPEERAAGSRYQLTFNPWQYVMACERLLLQTGVRLLYGIRVCGVFPQDGRVGGVLVEGREGRFAIRARSLVDATGDACVLHAAGVPTRLHPPGNQLAAWYGYAPGDRPPAVKILGVCDAPEAEPDQQAQQLSDRRFAGLDSGELTELTCLSHRQVYLDAQRQRQRDPRWRVTCLPVIPQVRMTRRLAGEWELNLRDEGRSFADSVGLIGSWRRRGPVYAIPLRSLYHRQAANLFAAGRCISAVGDMWDLTRVIPACAVTGEAAGLAAAACVPGEAPDAVRLQQALRKRGIPLTPQEAGISGATARKERAGCEGGDAP